MTNKEWKIINKWLVKQLKKQKAGKQEAIIFEDPNDPDYFWDLEIKFKAEKIEKHDPLKMK